MNDHPYTDTDLRTEAARLYDELGRTTDDEGLIGERMQDHHVPSTGAKEDDSARTWSELLEPEGDGTPEYVAAMRAVSALIQGAADTSEWAVNLGADGLEPDAHKLTWSAGEQPIIRVHFAFHEGMSPEARDFLVTAVGEVLGSELERAVGTPAAVESPAAAEVCGKCRRPFDAADARYDGDDRFYLTPYCRRCVAGCHDTEIADHRCVICQ